MLKLLLLSPHRTESAQEAGSLLAVCGSKIESTANMSPKLFHAPNYMKHRFVCRCFYCNKTLYYNAEIYKQMF